MSHQYPGGLLIKQGVTLIDLVKRAGALVSYSNFEGHLKASPVNQLDRCPVWCCALVTSTEEN